MIDETVLASFLLACLAVFFAVNLHNITRSHRRSDAKAYAEIERPSGLFMGLAALGTFFYFLEAFVFIFLAFAGLSPVVSILSLSLAFPPSLLSQVLGMILTAVGYFVFIWSVIARGKYAVSWAMPGSQELVTWGPYRFVRHPSYLGYFLMFSGLLLMWLNVFALFPLLAIPGYYQLTSTEEKLLLSRFGEKYAEYKRKTGRFVPKIR